MAHPDHALWKQGWRDNQTPFHLTCVHPLLLEYWPRLGIGEQDGVFVPLCGKSLDLHWLHKRGHNVVGVELSPIAVRAFFKAIKLQPKKTNLGELTCWTQERLAIYCGDFFALGSAHLSGVRAVYDRAALTALPENLREPYVAHLQAILPANSFIFLITVEDLDDEDAQVEHMGSANEITSLYSRYFDIELLRAEYHDALESENGQPIGLRCIHKVYCLKRPGADLDGRAS